MIKRATSKDIDHAVALGARFHEYSQHKAIPYDQEAMAVFMGALVEAGILLLAEDGLLGGCLAPLYFNPSFKVATELFWYSPKEGRALRKSFEEWAIEHGAWAVQFSGMRDDRAATVDKVFRRAGYEPVETGYLKVL